MNISIKIMSAPIAAALIVVGLAASAQAAPRQLQQQVETGSSLIVDVDYRHEGRRAQEHRRDWQRGHRGGYMRPGHGARETYRMGPRQVRRSLRDQGFHRIRILDERGPVYVVRAKGWRGKPMRLIVDSRSGQILRKHRVHYRNNNGYRW
ncbi:hypothetical protein [Roseibium algae]|uniref:YpeB-like protein with protease inhibitory function n=1 Tax=Roseibium algae TaxID=3123038 RepID=A0ABU8TG22_9HYPH